jgi:hypothetical protein
MSAREPDYEAEMRLPLGKTCADCRHIKRCSWLIGEDGTDTSCDWHPSRFDERTAQKETP